MRDNCSNCTRMTELDLYSGDKLCTICLNWQIELDELHLNENWGQICG